MKARGDSTDRLLLKVDDVREADAAKRIGFF
jgi:hypothetical protein